MPPLTGPFTGDHRVDTIFAPRLLVKIGVLNDGLWVFPRASRWFGELREACRIFVSTYPGASPNPWCRLMAQSNGGFVFHPRYDLQEKIASDKTTSIKHISYLNLIL